MLPQHRVPRRGPELNRCTGFCRPLPNHSATTPSPGLNPDPTDSLRGGEPRDRDEDDGEAPGYGDECESAGPPGVLLPVRMREAPVSDPNRDEHDRRVEERQERVVTLPASLAHPKEDPDDGLDAHEPGVGLSPEIRRAAPSLAAERDEDRDDRSHG